MKAKVHVLTFAVALLAIGDPVGTDAAVGTAFTCQGRLKQGLHGMNGPVDLEFSLWDHETDTQLVHRIGNPDSQTVQATNGLFTALLNVNNEFGNDAFTGDARWLEITITSSNSLSSTVL